MGKIGSEDKKLGFIFGVSFLAVILGVIIFIPNPSESQQFVFRVIIALSGSGFANILLGTLTVNSKFNKFTIRAGGSLAVFVILYFFPPGISNKHSTSINQQIIGDGGNQIGENKGNITIQPRNDTAELNKK